MSEGAMWQNGICGCFNDLTTCVIVYFAPCYIAGTNAEAVGESCIVHIIVYFIPVANCICHGLVRKKIREQKNIPGSLVVDILLAWCCSPCALVQEAQEVKSLTAASMSRE